MKRAILFSIAILLLYYLIVSFIFGTFNLIDLEMAARFIITVGLVLPFFIIFFTILENQSFFFPLVVPHNEKIQGIRKYTGELKEELALYAEAKELEKRVEELRNKK